MLVIKKSSLAILTVSLLAALNLSPASAQTYPNRQITMVVPYPDGGGTNAIARLFAAEIGRVTGQSVVVENRPGGGGNTGADSVSKAAPDGYTILFSTPGPSGINKLMFKSMPYDPATDLAQIAYLAGSPIIIVGNPKLPANNMKELVAYAKANPGKLTIGHPGNGTYAQITALLFAKQTGIDVKFAPRGTAPLATDVVDGRFDLVFDFLPAYLPLVKDGKLRAYAVTAAKRVDLTPDVPTVKESGVADLEAVGWFVLQGPKGLPADIALKLNKIVSDYNKTDEAKAKLAPFGAVPGSGTPQDLEALVKGELAKWAPIIKDNNIVLE